MSRHLVSLSLPGNMINYEIIQHLIKSLLVNSSITQLDLSHNALSDTGARRIAKYIIHTKILTHLNLCDNNVGQVSSCRSTTTGLGTYRRR